MKGWSVICLETSVASIINGNTHWWQLASLKPGKALYQILIGRWGMQDSLMRGVSFHMALVEMPQQRWVITYLIGDPRYTLTWQKVFCNKSGWLTRINLLQWYGVVYWACCLLLHGCSVFCVTLLNTTWSMYCRDDPRYNQLQGHIFLLHACIINQLTS